MSNINNSKSCYDKYISQDDVLKRQECMYTANGEMVCGFTGNAVSMILGDKCSVVPNGGSTNVKTNTNGCTSCGTR